MAPVPASADTGEPPSWFISEVKTQAHLSLWLSSVSCFIEHWDGERIKQPSDSDSVLITAQGFTHAHPGLGGLHRAELATVPDLGRGLSQQETQEVGTGSSDTVQVARGGVHRGLDVKVRDCFLEEVAFWRGCD